MKKSQKHHFNRKEPPPVEASCSNPSHLPSVYGPDGPDGPDGLQRKWTMSTSPAAFVQLLPTVVVGVGVGGGVVAFSIQPESHFNLHLSSEAGERKENKATVVINDPKERRKKSCRGILKAKTKGDLCLTPG